MSSDTAASDSADTADTAAPDSADSSAATSADAAAPHSATDTTTHYFQCVLCEASCGLVATLDKDKQIQDLRGHAEDPLSRGHICPKAFALKDIHDDPDRLKTPVRRINGEWTPISWEEAVEHVATRLHEIQETHGRNAVGIYLGNPNVHSLGALTHGLNLVRTIKTRNVFSATSVDQLPHQGTAWALYGHQFLIPVPDIDRTDLLVLIGHNPMASNGSIWTVPAFPQRRRELAARGGKFVVIDPRRTETAKVADEHHFIRPGTDVFALLAILRSLLERGSRAPAYSRGWDQVREIVEPFTAEVAERLTGMRAAALEELAGALWSAERAAVHGRMGLSTQRFGLVGQWAVQLINLVTGNLDREGGTMFTSPVVDSVAKGMVGKGHLGAWQSRVRGLPEFGSELPVSVLREEIETPGEGQIRAMLTIAGNPVLSTPAGHRLSDALAGLEFMVAIDFYINETTRHADVILPPTGPLERDHYDLIFNMLAVRNTARWSEALYSKSKEQRHDWQIARDVALALKKARGESPSLEDQARFRLSPKRQLDVLLRTGSPRTSVRKLRKTPGGIDAGPLKPLLPERLMTEDKQINVAVDFVLEHVATLAEQVASGSVWAPDDDELLLIGRRHQRDNNSWLHNAPTLVKGRARHHLLMHPEDAATRSVSDGDRVTITSAAGKVEVDVALTEDMMPGVVSLPHGYGHQVEGVELSVASGVEGVSINDLTDPDRVESVAANAVLNGVPVRVERA